MLLTASSLARVRLGSKDVAARDEESLLLLTLNALLREQVPRVHRSEHPGDPRAQETLDDPAGPATGGDAVAERILVAAMEELAERGAPEFRIRAVMEAAGVSTTLIYKYF